MHLLRLQTRWAGGSVSLLTLFSQGFPSSKQLCSRMVAGERSSSVVAGSVSGGRVCVMEWLTVLMMMMRMIVTGVLVINSPVVEGCACHGPGDVMDRLTARIVGTRRAALATAESSPAMKVLASLQCMCVMGGLIALMVLTSRAVLVMLSNSSVAAGLVWRVGDAVMVAMIVETCRMRRVVAALLGSFPVVMDLVSTSLRNVMES